MRAQDERVKTLCQYLDELEDRVQQKVDKMNLGDIAEVVEDHNGHAWEKIDITIDSGAAEHVSSPKVGQGVEVRETEASKKGLNLKCNLTGCWHWL